MIAIRPEPGLASTKDAARARGIELAGFPLSEIVPVNWDLRDPDGFDGLLVGSANAFRHGGERLGALTNLPVYAVGEATAAAAREAGFAAAVTGSGGLQNVLDGLAGQRLHLLRLAGEDRVTLDLPEAMKLTERVVYRSQRFEIPADMAVLLAAGAIVLLHSAVSANHFAQECERLGIDRSQVQLAALGPRIASAAGGGWGAVHIASQPSDAALLALIGALCH